ncbi:MAG: hypothetical protein AUI14_20580 [Actinobacteria bacterium 13_2_20CM_2_71_6]|nr:MAG: hypothetical protein AUI14_20580 [Actinobacteria bacterium 13_2_20CM_2_71_6]
MASSKTRQRKLARAKMERQMARRAAKVRRQRQLWAGLIVGLVAILGITGTVWALGGFSPSKKPPAPAACNWADTGAGNAKLKNVGKPPTSGEPRSGTETMTITTSLGVITAKLDLAKSPCTAASFAYLAGKNFFANTKCHKLTTAGKFLLECGDPNPNPTGDGGPTYTYANEYIPTTPAPAPSSANPVPSASESEAPNEVIYPAGSVITANKGPDLNGSRFSILYKDSPLPPDYTLFGTVVTGLDIVQQVAAAGEDGAYANEGGGGRPKKEITIQALTVVPPGKSPSPAAPASPSASTSPSASPSAKS